MYCLIIKIFHRIIEAHIRIILTCVIMINLRSAKVSTSILSWFHIGIVCSQLPNWFDYFRQREHAMLPSGFPLYRHILHIWHLRQIQCTIELLLPFLQGLVAWMTPIRIISTLDLLKCDIWRIAFLGHWSIIQINLPILSANRVLSWPFGNTLHVNRLLTLCFR